MTMSAADFLDQWFETDPLKATMSASGIIGTYQGIRSPGHGVRPAPPLHGRDRRRLPRLGHPQGRHGRRVSYSIARAAQALGAEIRTEAPVARIVVTQRPRDRRRRSRTARRSRRRVVLSLGRREGHLPRPPGARHARRRRSSRRSAASSSAAAPARSTSRSTGCRTSPACPARASTSAARSRSAPSMRRDGAGLRRREVRPLEQPPVHRHDHPDAGRPADGAARQARDQLLRPVRAVQAGARARHLGRQRARRSATRSSTGSRSSRPNIRDIIIGRQVLTPLDIERTMGLTEGNIFQGELSPRAAVLQPAGARVRPVPDAGRRTSGCRARRPTRAAA